MIAFQKTAGMSGIFVDFFLLIWYILVLIFQKLGTYLHNFYAKTHSEPCDKDKGTIIC